ncbi:MAG: aquaporin [Candidatus Dormiibacterota bacterium]|jgi:aquaporin Z
MPNPGSAPLQQDAMADPPAGGSAGATTHAHTGESALAHADPPWIVAFRDSRQEWRRLFAELFGTFMLVSVAAGAGVVSALSAGSVGRTAEVVAPALMVMAIILSMGKVSGAHLNPVVSLAFALRKDFPWRRVPAYLLMQFLGATLACLFLSAVLGQAGMLGATEPGARVSGGEAMMIEALLTLGLVTTILGTSSGAQNVGPLSALAVAGYIALAGLWASPISGASMNPARSFGPEFVIHDFTNYWVYLIGPVVGMVVAVAIAYVLRGPGGRDPAAEAAAQGAFGPSMLTPVQTGGGVPPRGTKP